MSRHLALIAALLVAMLAVAGRAGAQPSEKSDQNSPANCSQVSVGDCKE